MASVPTAGRIYQNIQSADNSRMHLGDVYHDHRSPDERALEAILDSLSYPGMTDRRDALAEAHEKTFGWTLSVPRDKSQSDDSNEDSDDSDEDSYDSDEDGHATSHAKLNSWLQQDANGLFCVMGKPGSGKSTFMCVQPIATHGNLG